MTVNPDQMEKWFAELEIPVNLDYVWDDTPDGVQLEYVNPVLLNNKVVQLLLKRQECIYLQFNVCMIMKLN